MNPVIINADCLDALRAMPDASVDAIVTDPPYGLSNTRPDQVAETITRWASGDREFLPSGRGFMGHEWDGFVPPPAVWDECLRVLKPGGHLIAFAGSRTHDLMGLSIRLAGFEVRDSVAWLYGSGFPKSLDVSKAIESHTLNGKSNSRTLRQTEQDGDGAAYTLAGKNNGIMGEARTYARKEFAPATDAARQWEGWGTALKPAFEPVTLARKPLEGTVAANVLEHGTGALNVDACRVGDGGDSQGSRSVGEASAHRRYSATGAVNFAATPGPRGGSPAGRWPANVVLDESQAEVLDGQSGNRPSSGIYEGDGSRTPGHHATDFDGGHRPNVMYSDSGGASRFFYVAKAAKSERPVVDGIAHPTVKPVALMRWLVRMVTPPGGTVLDPFAGSGTTLEAALMEGVHCIGVEREADYLPLIQHRIDRATTARQAAEDKAAGYLFNLEGDAA